MSRVHVLILFDELLNILKSENGLHVCFNDILQFEDGLSIPRLSP